MADKAHAETDKEISKIQGYIAGIYRKAQKEISSEFQKYTKTIKEKSDKLMEAITNAEDAKAKKNAESAYKRFYVSEVKTDRRFKKTAQTAAERLYRANKEAAQYINTKTANVYAINYNQIGNGLKRDLDGYDFKPVSKEDAEKYGEITRQTVDKEKDTKWNRKNILNAVIAGALLLYSTDKIFQTAAKTITGRNRDGGNRQASDTLADAESKGRLDSMYRASDEGFVVKKYWIATKDNRTRESHIEYDGMEPVELDFEYAPGLKKPKDPNCSIMAEVCNCRCRILYDTGREKSRTTTARRGEVTGSYKKQSSFRGTETVSVQNMTYREWMKWRSR